MLIVYYLSDCHLYISYIFLYISLISKEICDFYICYIYIRYIFFCIYVFFSWLFMKNANYSLCIYSSHQMCLKWLFISNIHKLKHPILSKIYITYISFLYIYLYTTPSISGSSIYFFLRRNWSAQNVICYITYLSN